MLLNPLQCALGSLRQGILQPQTSIVPCSEGPDSSACLSEPLSPPAPQAEASRLVWVVSPTQATVHQPLHLAHLFLPVHTPHKQTPHVHQWHHLQEGFPDHLPTLSPALWAGTDVTSPGTDEDLRQWDQEETSRVTKSMLCRTAGPRQPAYGLGLASAGISFSP